jgi:hypothetical protein
VHQELEERAAFTQETGPALLGCADCGLLLRWPRPKPDELIETYAEERYRENRIAEMVAAQVDLYRRKIPVLRRLLGERGRLVEVGSFLGGFLEVARTAGLDALGVDPNHQMAESCRERGLRVFEGTLEALLAEHESLRADGVLIWNTFDQLADPRRARGAPAPSGPEACSRCACRTARAIAPCWNCIGVGGARRGASGKPASPGTICSSFPT